MELLSKQSSFKFFLFQATALTISKVFQISESFSYRQMFSGWAELTICSLSSLVRIGPSH